MYLRVNIVYCLHRCHNITPQNKNLNNPTLDYDENAYEDMDCSLKLEKKECLKVTLEPSSYNRNDPQSSGIYEEIH